MREKQNRSLCDRTFITNVTQHIISTQQWTDFWFPFYDLINRELDHFQETL